MTRIRLPGGEWEYDEKSPLGPRGGFGTVFAGRGEEHGPVAVKRLHVTASDAAHRELRIADELVSRDFDYIVPILDAGQDTESDFYYVVMAQAETSLQQELERVGKFAEADVVNILRSIASGLAEVREIVHRDLKPGNVLFHEGKWKIADFGIARFVEESTSLQTLKGCLSPQYAAPEQWRLERAESVTDIYALGCIAYALLSGSPPFHGPKREDYREQHLHMPPPSTIKGHPKLRSLVSRMLRKPTKARPNIDRVIEILDNIVVNGQNGEQGGGLNALMQAGAEEAEAIARTEAAQLKERAKQEARQELTNSAVQILSEVLQILMGEILDVLPLAILGPYTDPKEHSLRIQLGQSFLQVASIRSNTGQLGTMLPVPISEDAFRESGWDVIMGAFIRVVQGDPKPYRWGANLWYTNLGEGDQYRWWEVLYYRSLGRHQGPEPFAITTNLSDADRAASVVMHSVSFAAKPRPVDDENIGDFCNRWAELLAKAYKGQLTRPSLPLE